MNATRKIKIVPRDNGFYSYFKKEQREQNKALNIGIGIIHANSVLKNIDSGAEKRINKIIENLKCKISKLEDTLEKAKTDKKKESIQKAIITTKGILESELKAFKQSEQFRKGLDDMFNDTYLKSNTLEHVLDSVVDVQYKYTLSLVSKRLKLDYGNDFVSIMTGESSVRNYKNDNPLMFATSYLKLRKENDSYTFRVMSGYDLDVVLGRRNNENVNELRSVLDKIISNEYKMCNSSMQMDGKNLILNLVIDIPPSSNKYIPVKDRTLGVDLGLAVPVYMCVGDNTYKRKSLGDINNFLRVRKQMQERRKKYQKDVALTNGGKGRKKKTQLLDKLKENESNFCQTYNHKLSKEIVKFAKTNKCEYINMEYLTKDGFPDIILRNWSFHQLRTMVEYKARREGIELRLVDPSYTSQMCSECGHTDSDNRPKKEKGQAYFKCTECGFELNADHNASINIARSKNFMK